MCSENQARQALEGLGLVDGLAPGEVHLRIARACRLGEVGDRSLAFYLLDTEERRLYQDWDHGSTKPYAQARFDLSPRRTRELLWAGRKLRTLPRVDEAFCDQAISWTKVLILLRVVSPEHEEVWIEKAKALNCKKLRSEVAMAKEGGPPREPGDVKGLPELRYRKSMVLDVVTHELQKQAMAKLAAEREWEVTAADLQAVLLDIYLNLERDGSAPGWKRVPSSLYRIVLRPWIEQGSEEMPLLVETEDGLRPISTPEAGDVIARNRTACAACDGEVVADDDEDIDVPTPSRLRTRVLARDGNRCRCCGRRTGLHVHHLVFRSKGGRTKIWNLITMCVLCHALVHEGTLRLAGKTQRRVRFFDREGRPLHNPGQVTDPSVILKMAVPEPRLSIDPPWANGDSVPTLEGLPDAVDAAWWQRHADLIKDRGARGLELRPGRPARIDAEDSDGDATNEERLSSDEAFRGLVGQDVFLERIRDEADGASLLGEAFPHTLLMGPPGTGKTTLARGIAAVTGSRLVVANGPTLRDVHDLICLLASLRRGDVLFLDEIHAVPQAVIETLYEAMDRGEISLRFRRGAETKATRLELASFTLIGATTHPGSLPRPLKSRFPVRQHLEAYSEKDLAVLATRVANDHDLALTEEAAGLVASHARGIPREAKNLVEQVRRLAATRKTSTIEAVLVKALLARMGYDEQGLTREERRYLEVLRQCGVPVSLARLVERLGIDVETVQREIEPWLERLGLVRVSERGRMASPRIVSDGDSRMGLA